MIEEKMSYEVLLSVVKQVYASAVWTHKTQEKQSDIYNKYFIILENINIVLLCISSTGIIYFFIDYNRIIGVSTCIISFLSLMATLFLRVFDPLKLANSHKNAANKLLWIRDKLLILISDIECKRNFEDLNKRFKEINDDLHVLYSEIPSTSDKALNEASKSLKNGEYTFNEDEIDCYLPPFLRSK